MSAADQDLVEAITKRVIAVLAGRSGDRCADCVGGCAASCGDKVRQVVGEGARRITFHGTGGGVPTDLAGYIDHTLLRPDVTPAEIDKLCAEARQYHFAAVCVNPVWVARCAQNVRGSAVKVASVVGFPLGASRPEIKAAETRRALRDGAREIDMVLNVGALKAKDYALVERDIAGVAEACREVGAECKVILETGLLTDEEKVVACQLAVAAKATYVKTSTGFGPGGATVFDIALMRESTGGKLGVKASGGVRNTEQAQQMIAAGATRIGASAGVQIVSGKSSDKSPGGAASGKY
jgi:deoxyribose-phosphate aldolase